MTGLELKERLRKGERIYGTAILSTSPLWPPVVKQCGLDFVFLDTEHIPLSRSELSQLCQVYAALGLPPIVRIPKPDPAEANKVLDGGAAGVVAPYVESSSQVRTLIGACTYRPLKGKLLKEKLNDLIDLPAELTAYLEERNRSTLCLINIESAPALENIDAILAVDGLDAVIIGPHDLSCSLGLPGKFAHPKFEAAVKTIIEKTRARGLGVGIHLSETPDLQIRWAREGVNIILHSSDIALFGQALQRDISAIRQNLGDERSGDQAPAPVV